MANLQDKQKYWEWRQKNNPFEDPSKRGYKPGYFENAPGRRIFLLWLPTMFATLYFGNWYARRQNNLGRGVVYVSPEAIRDHQKSVSSDN